LLADAKPPLSGAPRRPHGCRPTREIIIQGPRTDESQSRCTKMGVRERSNYVSFVVLPVPRYLIGLLQSTSSSPSEGSHSSGSPPPNPVAGTPHDGWRIVAPTLWCGCDPPASTNENPVLAILPLGAAHPARTGSPSITCPFPVAILVGHKRRVRLSSGAVLPISLPENAASFFFLPKA